MRTVLVLGKIIDITVQACQHRTRFLLERLDCLTNLTPWTRRRTLWWFAVSCSTTPTKATWFQP